MKQLLTLYVHGSKESAWDAGKKIGLSDEALRGFCPHYEHEMTYEVDAHGESTLVAVDGRRLSNDPLEYRRNPGANL